MSKPILAACAFVALAVLPAPTASAHHSWQNATYTGSVGGGTMTFTITNFTQIDRIEFVGVQTSCGEYPFTPTSVEITDHTVTEFGFSGAFNAPQSAQGTLVYHRNGSECISEPVPWTVTTSDPAAPHCSDGVDNDGDGKYDTDNVQQKAPEDPGCASETDNDETDPAAEPECPGDPGCPPPPPDTKRPVASAVDVFSRKVFFRLSEKAKVTFTLERRKDGRWVRLGRFRRAGKAGSNDVRIPDRVGGSQVRTGRYRVSLVPKDPAGNVGKRKRRAFEIL